MNDNALKEYASKIKENKKEMVTNQINELYDSLVNVGNAKLPENIFIEYFLNHFMSGGGDISNPLNIKWIELSGSLYNEVDIIDASGNIIYTVPPLLDQPNIDKSLEDINFNNIASTFNLKTNNMPALGINYLNNALNGMDKKIKSNNKVIYAERWKNIFARYQQPTKTKAVDKVTVIKTSNIDNYVDYD